MTAPIDASPILETARAACRANGYVLNPYRLGRYVGEAGYTKEEVPAPYANSKSVRLYATGVSTGLNTGGKQVRRDRIATAWSNK